MSVIIPVVPGRFTGGEENYENFLRGGYRGEDSEAIPYVNGEPVREPPGPTTPTVTLSVSPSSVDEDGTENLVFTFTRNVSDGPLVVNYAVGGTAENGTDYATITSPVSFLDGSTTTTVVVNPSPNSLEEGNRTVALTLLSGSGYTVGTAGAVVGTISDNDAPSSVGILPEPTLYLPLTENLLDVSENEFENVSAALPLIVPVASPISATSAVFTTDGTGGPTAYLEFQDDPELDPGTEDFFVTGYLLSGGSGLYPSWYSKGAYQSSTGALNFYLGIGQNEWGAGFSNPWRETDSAAATTPTVTWNRITVSRSGSLITLYEGTDVADTVDATGLDLTSTHPVRIGADFGGDALTSNAWRAWMVDVAYYKGAAITPEQLEFLADNPYSAGAGATVSQWSIATTEQIIVSEGAGAVQIPLQRLAVTEGSATLEFVPAELAGGAQAGVDYVSPPGDTGTVSFADGVGTANASITLLSTAGAAPSKGFLVGIQNPSTGTLSAPRTARVLIVNNKGSSRVMFVNSSYQTTEDAGVVQVKLIRAGSNSGSATVRVVSENGIAVAGTDYVSVNGLVSFAPGEVEKTVNVIILNQSGNQFTRDFTLTIQDVSNSGAADAGFSKSATVTILDTTSSIGDLTRSDFTTGLTEPTGMDWLPTGELLVAQKGGIIRLIETDGSIRSTAFADLSADVNSFGDRGCLGVAVHPEFGEEFPYVYTSYAYDPPETVGESGLAGPDGAGNRFCRVDRMTVDLETLTVSSRTTIIGNNSVTAYLGTGLGADSTGDIELLPNGIVNGTTIPAPAASEISTGYQDNSPGQSGTQNQNIRDYLTCDSTSHMIGGVRFGPDGYLYVPLGDGTSFNFVDPRAVRCQDIGNLSGTLMRVDPISGNGVPDNPYYAETSGTAPGTSNQSKVFYYGVRNPFRYTFDPRTNLPVLGDVGYGTWESIISGPPGSNFGWPYLEGGAVVPGYSSLPQAEAFIANGNINAGSPNPNPVVEPIVRFSHGAPSNFNSLTMGDFWSTDVILYSDLIDGRVFAGVLSPDRTGLISTAQIDTLPYLTEIRRGPDGNLYGCQLYSDGFGPGRIVRWIPEEE